MIIWIILILIIGGFLFYVYKKPSEIYIVREILIKAKPEKIFPHINSLKLADEWMPWIESDLKAVVNYSGEGVGSTSSWDSNGKMGTGQAEIVESLPNQKVITKLTYTRPMVMSRTAEISLTPSLDGTLVRWSVTGKNNFFGRLICVFMDLDKMVGSQFEAGLEKLKKTMEK